MQRWSLQTNRLSRVDGSATRWQEFLRYRWPLSQGETWEAPYDASSGDTLWQVNVRGWKRATRLDVSFGALRVELSRSGFSAWQPGHEERDFMVYAGGEASRTPGGANICAQRGCRIQGRRVDRLRCSLRGSRAIRDGACLRRLAWPIARTMLRSRRRAELPVRAIVTGRNVTAA